MHQSLRGYTTAVASDAAAAGVGAKVADEINAVAHLVSRTHDLAIALTDVAVPVAARRDVLRDLLTGRVLPATVRLVVRAAETERADEFPTVLHELAELCMHIDQLRPEELRAEEPITNRSAWKHFAGGYAAALFDDLDNDRLEEIEDELFRFTRVVEAHPALRSALADAGRPVAERERLIRELLEGRVQAATVRLATVTLQGRVRDLVLSLDWLVEETARARGWRLARVRTAQPIDDAGRRRLSEAMEHLTGRPVELQISEDPSLLGGAVVHIGDLLVDASARHRLEQLHEHLLGAEETTRGVLN